MTHDEFATVHNRQEQAVFDAVKALSPDYPGLEDDAQLLADVACVALNRLPPRYIRHQVDYLFYLTEPERTAHQKAVHDAVRYAFEFVQARSFTGARR